MAQKTDPQDIILVCNIDTNCDDFSQDVVRTSRRLQDPETGAWTTLYEEQADEWSHAEFFQVRWSGYPHRIRPGETRLMPRYIAEHYAKHLADHILGLEEKKTGRRGLLQSRIERPKTLAKILLSVEQYYYGATEMDDGAKGAAAVEALNQGERPLDLGVIPHPTIGILKDEPPSVEEIMKKAGEEVENNPQAPVEDSVKDKAEEMKTSLFDKDKPLPVKAELIKTAVQLGIDIKGSETSEQLANLIRSF